MLFFVHCIKDNRNRLIHVLHEKRIIYIRLFGIQILSERFPRLPSAVIQKLQQFAWRINGLDFLGKAHGFCL